MKKLLSLLLVLSMLLSVLVACNGDGDGTDSTESTSDPSRESTTNPDDEGEKLVLVDKGEAIVKVIYPDEGSSAEKDAASAIAKMIQNNTGVTVETDDDFIPRNETRPEGVVEILVGQTDYDECRSAMEGIGYGDYVIKVVGTKLVVAAYDDDAIEKARTAVRELLVASTTGEEGEKTLAVDADYASVVSITPMMTVVPMYDVADEDSTMTVSDMGDNARLIVVTETNKEEYDAFLTKLETNFTKKEQHEIANEKNHYAMYANSQYMVTALFIDSNDTARIIVEECAETGYDEYLTSTNNTAKVCEPLLLFVGNNHPSDTNYTNGLTVIVRLSNGDFLVYDGGWSDSIAKSSQSATRIRSLIKKNAAAGDDDIHIAAWLVTHAHTDHIGAIDYYLKNYLNDTSITIDNILINFPSDRQAGQPSFGNSGVDVGMVEKMATYRTLFETAEKAGVNVHKTHTGQILTFGDATLEILFTYDLMAPTFLTSFNTLSIVSRLTVEGQTIMVTGDTTTQANAVMKKMYGTDMHADFYTIPHHGNGPNTTDFGKTVAPKWLLWPSSQSHYELNKANGHNTWFWSSDSTVEKLFVADFLTWKIPLPFDGTTYTVEANTGITQ